MPGCSISFFRRAISFALYGHAMQNLWTLDILQIIQYGHQVIDIMAIHRTKISEVKGFKKIALA